MGRFLLRRLVALIGVLFASTIVVFLVLALVPGDPATLILGQDATPERVRVLRIELGLDRPLWEQYGIFLARLSQGDLGESIASRRPVLADIAQYAPATIELATLAAILTIAVGVPLGILEIGRAHV